MPQAFYILFGAAFTVALLWASGKLLLHSLAIKMSRDEENALALVVGAPLLSTLVFLLASLRLIHKGVLLAVGAAILFAAWRRGAWRSSGESLPPLPKTYRWLFVVVFAAFTFLYFWNAMAPEMSPDGSGYHLGLVSRYARERGFQKLTTNMYANLSQGIEMLYLAAFVFGRHSAAALVHFAFLITAPFLIINWARRAGLPAVGVGGAILFFAAPVVGIDGTTAYNDVATATVIFAVFALLEIWDRTRQPALFIPIGLLAGFGYASKYTAFLAVPYALGYIAWRTRRNFSLRPLLIVGSCAFAMMLPWLAKNALWLGNPFSPFGNRWFPNPYVSLGFELEYIQLMRHYGDPKSYWDLPLDLTVKGSMLAGFVGPMFLLTPLMFLALRRSEGRRLVFAAVLFALPYANNIGTRFLIPALPFISLALALTLWHSRWLLPIVAGAHALLSYPPIARHYCAEWAWRLERFPIVAALRITPEDSWLSERSPGYQVARMIEHYVPPGETVFSFTGIAEAYTTRNVLIGYQATSNSALGEGLWMAFTPDWQGTNHLRYRFTLQPLRAIRIVQRESNQHDWSLHEIRIYANGKEIPRDPSWRVRANANPWEAPLAFDNSPTTRWRSRQPSLAGQAVELHFPAPVTIDMVELNSPPEEYFAKCKVEGLTPGGQWRTLAEDWELKTTRPLEGFRRVATEELLLRGIRYLVIHNIDPGASDFRKNTEAWGLTMVGERGEAQLYRIEERK